MNTKKWIILLFAILNCFNIYSAECKMQAESFLDDDINPEVDFNVGPINKSEAKTIMPVSITVFSCKRNKNGLVVVDVKNVWVLSNLEITKITKYECPEFISYTANFKDPVCAKPTDVLQLICSFWHKEFAYERPICKDDKLVRIEKITYPKGYFAKVGYFNFPKLELQAGQLLTEPKYFFKILEDLYKKYYE